MYRKVPNIWDGAKSGVPGLLVGVLFDALIFPRRIAVTTPLTFPAKCANQVPLFLKIGRTFPMIPLFPYASRGGTTNSHFAPSPISIRRWTIH